MTAKKVLDKYYPYPNDFHEGCDLYKAMQEYARIKCLEAIRNTRYAAIEIIQNNFTDREENVILLSVAKDVHNIRNENVMPKL